MSAMSLGADTITFDCYGTLVDWEGGITQAFMREAALDRVELSAEQIIEAYHHEEPKVQTDSYRPYRDVLAETAVRVAERLSWALPHSRAGFLAESLPDWPVFDDTRAGLERLKSSYKLAILSNIDDDLLRATIDRIGVDFDWVITAQQVRSYKPAHAHFSEAVRRVEAAEGRLLHAAQSLFHDIRPATELGIACVWVNRKGERLAPGCEPLKIVRDVAGLAGLLLAD